MPLRQMFGYITNETFKVCAKLENHEKINYLFYIFPNVFLGEQLVFLIKNGNFQAFFCRK